MPHFTVDWFSHNIPSWQHVFDGLGWLHSGKRIDALEVRFRQYALLVLGC